MIEQDKPAQAEQIDFAALSSSNMRHVINGVKALVEDAMKG